ncbi:MAG: type VI secretion system tube protein Hcp, partial [bacterium]|nr:type VI secretion system tube protein Hcp [bacterium]
ASDGGNLPRILEGENWLAGSSGNAGRVPAQIAEQLSGRNFSNFDHFRREFWRAVGNDPVLYGRFRQDNIDRMQSGRAPYSTETQQVGGRNRYELDHFQELQFGGSVYDMNNLIIRTPLNHIRGR